MDDGHGQREPELDGRPRPGVGPDLDGALEVLDVPLHHVHPHAPPGDVGDQLAGAEARNEDQVDQLRLGDRGQVGGRREPLSVGLLLERGHGNPGAVVGELDQDVAPLVAGPDSKGSPLRLPGGPALRRRLDPMVDAVSDHVEQRVADLFDDLLVELGLGALDDEIHCFVEPSGEVPDGPPEGIEDGGKRHHPHPDGPFLKVAGEQAGDVDILFIGGQKGLGRLMKGSGRGPDLLPSPFGDPVRGIGQEGRLPPGQLFQLPDFHQPLFRPGVAGDDLAHELDQLVELVGVDPDRPGGPDHPVGRRPRRRRRDGFGRRRCRRSGGFGRLRHKVGRRGGIGSGWGIRGGISGRRRRLGRRFRCRGRRRHRLAGRRPFQGRDEIRRGIVKGSAGVHRVQHRLDGIDRPKEEVRQALFGNNPVRSKAVQGVFELVSQLADRDQLHHPGGPLDGVSRSEYAVQSLGVIRGLFQADQPRAQRSEVLPRLFHEPGDEF